MTPTYGSKRVVVGAHYGLRDWLSQRITAALMALFTLAVLVQVLLPSSASGYDRWAGIFASQWMKLLTFVTVIALLLTSMHMTLLGALLALASRPLYAHAAHQSGAGQEPGLVRTADLLTAVDECRRVRDVVVKIRYGQYL